MFLIKRVIRTVASSGGGERGSAMLAVLGVMAVASSIALTTTSMSMHAVGYTTSTRAGVQAEAAAEAGIDFAAASLATSVCQSLYTSTSTPIFSVTVAYSNLATSPGTTDTSWASGCPPTTSAQRLKLASTGTANTPGLAGNSSENIRKVEAIFPYTPTPPPNAIIPSGAAIYSYSQVDPTINNLTITQASTTRASIQYLSGSATCTSGSTIVGDVIFGGGGLKVASGCTIDGDLWTSDNVNIQSGTVKGNVNSGGTTGNSVTLSNSATVDGNVFSAGPVSVAGKVGGDVVAGPVSGNSTFTSNSSVGGSVISAGTVSAASGAIKGTITTNQTGIVTPSIPIVPGWIDYAYNASDWKTSSGSPYTVLTLTACDSTTLSNALATTQNSLTPIILDTRICGSVTDLGGNNMMLTSDTVIIGSGFRLNSNDFESSDPSAKRLWIIIPDVIADAQPTCQTNSSAKIINNVVIGAYVGALFYSPCPISTGGSTWRGQLYASSVGSSAPFTLNFLPIGLPTVNLSTGKYISPPGTGVLGSRTSIRDLTVG
jgi:hypothetical protein